MPHPQDPPEILAAHLEWVYRTAQFVARRHGCTPEEAEDFRGWVLEHLVADDYAALRRFRGESSITTYLTVVVASQMRDFRAARRGRWRPSAEAKRIGPPAPRLELLVLRQGYTLQQAAEQLRTSGETSLTDLELADLLGRLPTRGPMRPTLAGDEALAAIPAGREPLGEMEAAGERERVHCALRQAMLGLEPEDQVVLRMHFWEGASVQAVARALGLDPKPLYKRMDRLRTRLRRTLESAGVDRSDALSTIGRE